MCSFRDRWGGLKTIPRRVVYRISYAVDHKVKHVCFVDMVLPKLKYPVLYTVMYVLLLDVSKAFDKVAFNNYVI